MIPDDDVIYVDFDELFDDGPFYQEQEEDDERLHLPIDSSQDKLIVGKSTESMSRSSSGIITTGLIDSLIANQSFPVIQTKKPRRKRKEQPVRYIRNPSPSSNNSQEISEGDHSKQMNSSPTVAHPSDLSREQFYKMRPKIPKISRSDPRRLYANYFAKAYNSCDFQEIWQLLKEFCLPDLLYIQRWVGTENHFNFPKYLEIRGIEKIAEYWFSRCLIIPDMILQLKETKLYVRSDGLSTLLSSFTIDCTRLYDDAMFCQSFAQENKRQKSSSDLVQESVSPTKSSVMKRTEGEESAPAPVHFDKISSYDSLTEIPSVIIEEAENYKAVYKAEDGSIVEPKLSTKDFLKIPQSLKISSNPEEQKRKTGIPTTMSNSIQVEAPEEIKNRVFEKMKIILLSHMEQEKRKLLNLATQETEMTSYEGLRKKIEEDKLLLHKQQEKIRLFEDESLAYLQFDDSDEDEDDEDEEGEERGEGISSGVKKLGAEKVEDEIIGGSEEISTDNSNKLNRKKKRKLVFPKDRATALLGTITLHINQDFKATQVEITKKHIII